MVAHIRSIPLVYPLVAGYLFAVVSANLLVAAFGPAVVLINSFLLIGLDLSARDRLHDAWEGRGLWVRMAPLIGAGSVLSWVLNVNAGPVAVASFCAFALAGAADAAVYHLLRGRTHLLRINGSNIVSALVDSVVFLSLLTVLAGLPWVSVPLLVVGQWAAKTAGGLIWSWILTRRS